MKLAPTLLVLSALALGCGPKSVAGESCSKTADCADGLLCKDLKCVDPAVEADWARLEADVAGRDAQAAEIKREWAEAEAAEAERVAAAEAEAAELKRRKAELEPAKADAEQP